MPYDFNGGKRGWKKKHNKRENMRNKNNTRNIVITKQQHSDNNDKTNENEIHNMCEMNEKQDGKKVKNSFENRELFVCCGPCEFSGLNE